MKLERSIYSVISRRALGYLCEIIPPRQEAATALKVTAAELLKSGVINDIVPELFCGAHRDVAATIQSLTKTLHTLLSHPTRLSTGTFLENRDDKFCRMIAMADS